MDIAIYCCPCGGCLLDKHFSGHAATCDVPLDGLWRSAVMREQPGVKTQTVIPADQLVAVATRLGLAAPAYLRFSARRLFWARRSDARLHQVWGHPLSLKALKVLAMERRMIEEAVSRAAQTEEKKEPASPQGLAGGAGVEQISPGAPEAGGVASTESVEHAPDAGVAMPLPALRAEDPTAVSKDDADVVDVSPLVSELGASEEELLSESSTGPADEPALPAVSRAGPTADFRITQEWAASRLADFMVGQVVVPVSPDLVRAELARAEVQESLDDLGSVDTSLLSLTDDELAAARIEMWVDALIDRALESLREEMHSSASVRSSASSSSSDSEQSSVASSTDPSPASPRPLRDPAAGVGVPDGGEPGAALPPFQPRRPPPPPPRPAHLPALPQRPPPPPPVVPSTRPPGVAAGAAPRARLGPAPSPLAVRFGGVVEADAADVDPTVAVDVGEVFDGAEWLSAVLAAPAPAFSETGLKAPTLANLHARHAASTQQKCEFAQQVTGSKNLVAQGFFPWLYVDMRSNDERPIRLSDRASEMVATASALHQLPAVLNRPRNPHEWRTTWELLREMQRALFARVGLVGDSWDVFGIESALSRNDDVHLRRNHPVAGRGVLEVSPGRNSNGMKRKPIDEAARVARIAAGVRAFPDWLEARVEEAADLEKRFLSEFSLSMFRMRLVELMSVLLEYCSAVSVSFGVAPACDPSAQDEQRQRDRLQSGADCWCVHDTTDSAPVSGRVSALGVHAQSHCVPQSFSVVIMTHVAYYLSAAQVAAWMSRRTGLWHPAVYSVHHMFDREVLERDLGYMRWYPRADAMLPGHDVEIEVVLEGQESLPYIHALPNFLTEPVGVDMGVEGHCVVSPGITVAPVPLLSRHEDDDHPRSLTPAEWLPVCLVRYLWCEGTRRAALKPSNQLYTKHVLKGFVCPLTQARDVELLASKSGTRERWFYPVVRRSLGIADSGLSDDVLSSVDDVQHATRRYVPIDLNAVTTQARMAYDTDSGGPATLSAINRAWAKTRVEDMQLYAIYVALTMYFGYNLAERVLGYQARNGGESERLKALKARWSSGAKQPQDERVLAWALCGASVLAAVLVLALVHSVAGIVAGVLVLMAAIIGMVVLVVLKPYSRTAVLVSVLASSLPVMRARAEDGVGSAQAVATLPAFACVIGLIGLVLLIRRLVRDDRVWQPVDVPRHTAAQPEWVAARCTQVMVKPPGRGWQPFSADPRVDPGGRVYAWLWSLARDRGRMRTAYLVVGAIFDSADGVSRYPSAWVNSASELLLCLWKRVLPVRGAMTASGIAELMAVAARDPLYRAKGESVSVRTLESWLNSRSNKPAAEAMRRLMAETALNDDSVGQLSDPLRVSGKRDELVSACKRDAKPRLIMNPTPVSKLQVGRWILAAQEDLVARSYETFEWRFVVGLSTEELSSLMLEVPSSAVPIAFDLTACGNSIRDHMRPVLAEAYRNLGVGGALLAAHREGPVADLTMTYATRDGQRWGVKAPWHGGDGRTETWLENVVVLHLLCTAALTRAGLLGHFVRGFLCGDDSLLFMQDDSSADEIGRVFPQVARDAGFDATVEGKGPAVEFCSLVRMPVGDSHQLVLKLGKLLHTLAVVPRTRPARRLAAEKLTGLLPDLLSWGVLGAAFARAYVRTFGTCSAEAEQFRFRRRRPVVGDQVSHEWILERYGYTEGELSAMCGWLDDQVSLHRVVLPEIFRPLYDVDVNPDGVAGTFCAATLDNFGFN